MSYVIFAACFLRHLQGRMHTPFTQPHKRIANRLRNFANRRNSGRMARAPAAAQYVCCLHHACLQENGAYVCLNSFGKMHALLNFGSHCPEIIQVWAAGRLYGALFCQVLFIVSCKSLHVCRDCVLFCQLIWLKIVKSFVFACFFALKYLLLRMT